MRTCYLIISRWSDEIRPFTSESELPETPEDVLKVIANFGTNQSLYKIYRCEADEETMRDVTEDFQSRIDAIAEAAE